MMTVHYCEHLLSLIKKAPRRDPWLIQEVGRLAYQLQYRPDPVLERWFSVLFGAVYAKWG